MDSESDDYSFWSALMRFSALDEVVDAIVDRAQGRTAPTVVITANIQHIAIASRDADFRALLSSADVLVPDGWPVVSGLRLLGNRGSNRITGADLFPAVIARAEREGLSVGIVGGSEGVADKAKRRAESLHPNLCVVVAESPVFGAPPNSKDAGELKAVVNGANPDLLFLCVGTPKSEELARLSREQLSAGVVMCFGAAVDFYAGTRRRAPLLWRRLNAEWLYRLVSEPARLFPRYVESAPLFVASLRAEVRRRRQRAGAS